MGMPRRHGHNWSQMPSGPDASHGNAAGVRYKNRGPTPSGPAVGTRPNEIPIAWYNAWLQQLPPASVTQLFAVQEARFNHALLADQAYSIGTMQVPAQTVWVFTDVEYYGMVPAVGMGAPPVLMAGEALHGIVRFELQFSGQVPYQVQGYRLNAYATPTQTPVQRGGWPWLNKTYGVQRMPSFALYARSDAKITVQGVIEDPPRFPIVKTGVNLHGFSIPEAVFNDIWEGLLGKS